MAAGEALRFSALLTGGTFEIAVCTNNVKLARELCEIAREVSEIAREVAKQ